MITQNSAAKRTLAAFAPIFLLVALGAAPAEARDKEFGLLVHHLESTYHAKRSHRFLMGFAGLVVRVWRPYGVRGFKMALFEDQDFSAARSNLDFAAVVRAGLREGWQPLVRVYSRRDGERTIIFAQPAGNDIKLLIATVEPSEAVVMQMKINPDKLSESIDHRSHGCRQKPRENPDDTSHGSTDEPALHTVSEAAGT